MDNKDLLRRACDEIKMLRSSNQLMSARLEMFDNMMLLFATSPNFRSHGMTPDIAWEIDRAIDSLPE